MVFGVIMLAMPKASEAMTISPPMLDLTLNPGDVIADVVQIYNEEGKSFNVTPVPVNFYVADGDETAGTPDFYAADETRNGYELATWFVLNQNPLVVQPNERVNIPFQIHVPEDAQPGSHFGAIQLIASKPEGIADPNYVGVGLDHGTTVLVFVRVSGIAKDALEVGGFRTQSDIMTHLPAEFMIRLNNEGTTHQRPVGNVIIKDWFGRQVAALQVNPGPQFKTVLPGSSRRFDSVWINRRLPDGTGEYRQQMQNFAFGKYTATLLINYGNTKQMKDLTAVAVFWVIPWMALLTALTIVLISALVIVLLMRVYNKMLIRRYEASKQKASQTTEL